MDDNVKDILKKVSELRDILQSNISEKGIKDPDVASLSRKLDVVLNEYYKAIAGKD